MDALRFKPPFAFGRELPFDGAGRGVECVKLSVITRRVDYPIRAGRSARNRSSRGSLPNLSVRLGIDRINVSVVTSEIENLVVLYRRRHDPVAGGKLPFHPMKLTWRFPGRNAGAARVTAEHGLRMR